VTAVYLIRHAKAGSRLKWTKPDHLRPLTKAGRRQAEGLVALIEQPLERLVSSPYVRCVQTLEPLAEARDLALETADELAEGAPVEDALALMLSLAADGPAALCTHGDVMMFAVDELLAAGVPLEGPFEFKKGATWVIEVADGSFARGRYLPPPEKSLRLR
jgi:8-oxo-dGTP diphosphatase